MEPRKAVVTECTLNLGEIHRLPEVGWFRPTLTCRTPEGRDFTVRMRLHITEELDGLLLVDPVGFDDGGEEANSAGSKVLHRRSSFDSASPGTSRVIRPDLVPKGGLYAVDPVSLRAAILRGYSFPNGAAFAPLAGSDHPAIAFTCHDPNILGGGNIILFRLVNWLSALGVKVTIYSCGTPPTWTRVDAAFRSFESYAEMFAAIREEVVVLYSMWHIEPMLAAKPYGKAVHHIRQIYESCHYGTDRASMEARKPVIELLEGLPLGSIAIAPHLEQWYRERLGVESLLVTNGTDRRVFRPSAEPKVLGPVLEVASVGSPSHFVKGADVLEKALRLLAKRRPDLSIRWTVACGYEKKSPPEGTANLAIEYRHGLDRNGMRGFYHASDIVVNPSLYEGFGLPTLEAMACGAPVVHADNRGLDFIVKDGRDCLVVPIGDPDAMADAIERLHGDPDQRNRLVAAAHETVRRHSLESQYDLFLVAFAKILGRAFDSGKVKAVRRRFTDAGADVPYRPLVSVVIPAYNQAEYLREALDSLIAQTYPNWEAVVVNDGSKDHTVEVMEEYARRDARIRPFSKDNGGISSALNHGVDQARGDFFCWLSSDDLFYPDKIRLQVEAFQELGEEVALVYGSFDILQHETGKVDAQPFAEPLTKGAEFPEAMKFDFIDGCTIMIRMDVMREVRAFQPLIRHSQDMELWVRLGSRGYRFHLLPHKLTIRRVHVAQSSTGNMIHCRYDAAWMMAFYFRNFHLFEMYRYFDLTREDGCERFASHLVGRVLHTEANVNHPLIQERFWRWVDEGLEALPVLVQGNVLRKILDGFLVNRSSTTKIDALISRCLESLDRPRRFRRFDPSYSVEGRDLREDGRADDPFARDLFDYGCDLLINTNTPLFAQELYFHGTNKVVDTPYKLAHSVIRYLSQFPNAFREVCREHGDFAKIPTTREEALRLFVALRYPVVADLFDGSIAALTGCPVAGVLSDASEEEIALTDGWIGDDLAAVCGRGATDPAILFWHALRLASSGDASGALEAGWRALLVEDSIGKPAIARRVAVWAGVVGDAVRRTEALAMACADPQQGAEAGKELDASLSAFQSAFRRSPVPRLGVDAASHPTGAKSARLGACVVSPRLDGTIRVAVGGFTPKGKPFAHEASISLSDGIEAVEATMPGGEGKARFTARELLGVWSNGYDFTVEALRSLGAQGGGRPSIAFTIRESSIMGGGPAILYRYANWLSALGLDVAIYSDDAPPSWASLSVRFNRIPDAAERYAAIKEPVVVVYSVLELPDLLRHGHLAGKRVFHLCQGVEDFNYHGPSIDTLVERKPIFEILHSLPVGRIVVSPHLAEHFLTEYEQEALLVTNGIDLRNFRFHRSPHRLERLEVLFIGSPARLLKGVSDVRQALTLLARREPTWDIRLTIASGQRVPVGVVPDTAALGFRTELHWGLSASEMRDLYRRADLFVNAAWYEGFGLPTIEAMACGVPVVHADNRGLDTVVVDGKNCLVVPPQSPGRIAEAAWRIHTDSALRDRIVVAGRETSARFSLKRQFDEFLPAFEEVLRCKFDPTIASKVGDGVARGTLDERIVERGRVDFPLVSVLVPTYNHAKFLPEALGSLFRQNYGNWEAVVVNDGSTDETPVVLDCFASSDPRIRPVHTKNGGVSAALNEGIRHARGEWLCWLPSDDLFDARALATFASSLRDNPTVRFFHSHYFLLNDATGEIDAPWPRRAFEMPVPGGQTARFLATNFVHGSSVLLSRSLFDEAGFFDPALWSGQDFDMWLRMSGLGAMGYIDDRRVVTRVHGGQGTTTEPLAGVFDSARSAIAFLSGKRFEELFPLLDLTKREEVLFAVVETLSAVSSPEAFVFRLGPTSRVHAMLSEWVRERCPTKLRSAVSTVLRRFADAVGSGRGPSWHKELFRVLAAGTISSDGRGYAEVAEEGIRLLRAEGRERERRALSRYLARATGAPIPDDAIEDPDRFRVVAVMAAFNEGDIIESVVGNLVSQGIEVYLLDHNSTDDTVSKASRFLGKGLIRIERFPQESGYPAEDANQFSLNHILRRVEEICSTLDADWFVNHDLDEFRESPWPGTTLREGIRKADVMGYNAVEFELLNFRPVDDSFVPGGDPRELLRYYEGTEDFNARQIKAWKNLGRRVDIASTGGHDTRFEGRNVCPVKFILRHYPIRSQAHGEKKVLAERKRRFSASEVAAGWHVQYDHVDEKAPVFLRDPKNLLLYDGDLVRKVLLEQGERKMVAGGDLAKEGRSLKKDGRYAEALGVFLSAIKAGRTDVRTDAADCLAALGKFAEAREFYEGALASDPKEVKSLSGLGILALTEGNVADALRCFDAALALAPKDLSSLVGMGLACRSAGNADEGMAYLLSGLDVDPTNPAALHEVVREAFASGSFAEAESRLRRCLEHTPADANMLFSLAGVMHRKGRSEEALDLLDRLDLFSPGFDGGIELRERIESSFRPNS